MGQGYSLTSLSAGSAAIDIPELADLVHEKSLGTARFMKSIRARHRQGLVFVKAVVKPYPTMVLTPYVKAIKEEKNVLADVPNALGYQRILETSNGGFLLRQYIHSSVYDRMSTRPFLEDIEKKWLAFQLLSALRDCHARDVFHGDIKTENLLVTSWNWLYLTDFSSSFKPTFLPEDNPADFSFYFDTSGRRTCYLAPERFLAADEEPRSQVITWAMDIFSAGCVIAEMFLEGPIFSLSQLFKYRNGEYSPEHSHLNKIEDQEIRELITHMIQIDPESRYSADEYLNFWRRKAFPEYFYGFLHQYMGLITDPSSGRTPVNLETGNSGELDDKIDRIYLDFDKISYFLGFGKINAVQDGSKKSRQELITLPIGTDSSKHQRISKRHRTADDGSLIFLTLVAASLRNTAKASARVRACDLLVAFAQRLPDEAKLDRILPYLVTLLNDRSDAVKIAALTSLTQLLATITVVSPVNASIFQDYIFPRLRSFVLTNESQPSALVRATYASCLASLAQSSAHILDTVQAVKADGRLPAMDDQDWANEQTYHTLFDYARSELVAYFEEHTKALLTDPEPSVRRAFLGSVSTLCVFFGSAKANDVVLSHLNTYLNDKDWILRCAFFEALVGVAAFVGTISLETFVLPLMVQSLTDSEDFVVEKVLRSLAGMAELGLFQNSTCWELTYIVVRFVIHPSQWIREAAASFVVASTIFASAADKYCVVFPIIQPFLKIPMENLDEAQMMNSSKRPLPKAVFDMAMTWTDKSEKGLFWKAAAKDSIFILQGPDPTSRFNLLEQRIVTRIPPTNRNDEDEQWLTKLRGLGMQSDDDVKLMALREFILRVNLRGVKDDTTHGTSGQLSTIVKLSELKVKPTTIMFEETPRRIEPKKRSSVSNINTTHTIADALLDASTTIDETSLRGKRRSTAPMSDQVSDVKSAPRRIRSTEHRRDSSQLPSPSSSSLGGQNQSSGLNIAAQRRPRVAKDSEAGTSNSSPSDPERRRSRRESEIVSLRHRPSAINLMSRNENAKVDAATATTSTLAFGKVDGSNLQPNNGPSTLSLARSRQGSKSPLSQTSHPEAHGYKASHTYIGNDPAVLRLLDNAFLENFPIDVLDFGPLVTPLNTRHPIKRVTDQAATGINEVHHSEPWHPNGQLIALFGEHSGPVTHICVAPDHAFFLTGSDDGCVKIWDAVRLEKNVTPRSRQTHRHAQGTHVKSLCFIEDTHSFISGADDGTVHVVKIDYQNLGGESTRYGRPQLLRECHMPSIGRVHDRSPLQKDEEVDVIEYATHVAHHRTESSASIVLILTNCSRLIALDLKSMLPLYVLQNPVHYGVPTSFCLDRKNNWILIGTSHGILTLWDLRFRVQVRTWGIQGGTPIQRLLLHPLKGRGKWVVVAGGTSYGETTVWDIEKVICREVYRTSPSGWRPGAKDTNVPGIRAYEPWYPDDSPPQSLLSRFATTKSILEKPASLDPLHPPQTTPSPAFSTTTSLYIGTDTLYPPSTSSSTAAPSAPNNPDNNATSSSGTKTAFLLTGSTDRKLRFWDLSNPSASSIISGPPTPNTADTDVPHYETSHLGGNTMVVTEWNPSSATNSSSSPAKGKGREKTTSKDIKDGGAKPRSIKTLQQQQQLLRSHLDGITDCVVLERPYGLVVSGDRMGCVYVFQ